MSKTASNHSAIEVPVDELAAVAKWASRDADRPYLNMVVFSNDHYVAADGHRAVRVPCKMGGCGAFALAWWDIGIVVAAHREYVRHAVKLDGRSRFLHLELSNSGPRVLTARLALGVSVQVPWYDTAGFPLDSVDGMFKSQEHPLGAPTGYYVNPEFLVDMAEVHEGDRDDDTKKWGVRLVSWSDSKLKPLKFKNQRGVVFLIMPIRAPVPGVDTPPEASK